MDDSVRELVALGKDHFQRGDWSLAAGHLEQVIARGAAFADVHHMLGVCYHQIGEFDPAQRSFERALEINPGYVEASLNLAILCNDLGQYEKAQRVYSNALERARNGARRHRGGGRRAAARGARRSRLRPGPGRAGPRLLRGRQGGRGDRAMGRGPAHGPGPPHGAALPEAGAGPRAGGRRESAMTERAYALRFISGKYQGGEYPLQDARDLVIGRSSDLDMVLIEDMVSRKHAKITLQDGAITIADLGSTNGTFVNGEKVKKAQLKEGDRVLIGTSILKLVTVQ